MSGKPEYLTGWTLAAEMVSVGWTYAELYRYATKLVAFRSCDLVSQGFFDAVRSSVGLDGLGHLVYKRAL